MNINQFTDGIYEMGVNIAILTMEGETLIPKMLLMELNIT